MRVAIRADASAVIGSGHIMRTLTLAALLRDRAAGSGFRVELTAVGSALPPPLRARLDSAGIAHIRLDTPAVERTEALWSAPAQKHDAEAFLAALAPHPLDAVIVDHYGLSAPWHRLVRRHTHWITAIDDLANRPLSADLVINQTFAAPGTDRYGKLNDRAGLHWHAPAHALLNPAFACAARRARRRPEAGAPLRLHIGLGGLSQYPLVSALLSALAQSRAAPRLDICVTGDVGITGSAGGAGITRGTGGGSLPPHWQTLAAAFHSFHALGFVSDMPAHLADADLAIGAGGVSALERCVLGLPSLLLVLADNQRAFARQLVSQGAAFAALEADDLNPDILEAFLNMQPAACKAMTAAAKQLSDGRGAERASDAMLEALSHRNRQAAGLA